MIHYLTVQDILWINHEVCKRECEFKYAQLEEATFCQYGYGQSQDVLAQAASLLQGFIRMRPFEAGNRATAFIATLVFLAINGYDTKLDPANAYQLAIDVSDRRKSGQEAIAEIATESTEPPDLKPNVRTQVRNMISKYLDAVERLAD